MRGSLKQILSRVERLAQQTGAAAADDLRTRVDRMSDEEFHSFRLQAESEILQVMEQDIGSIATYPTADSLMAALSESGANSWAPNMLDLAREFWQRVHWFEQHASHGPPVLIRIEPEERREDRPYGLEMVFECPCAPVPGVPYFGSRGLRTYENLVPAPLRQLTPQDRWVPDWPPAWWQERAPLSSGREGADKT